MKKVFAPLSLCLIFMFFSSRLAVAQTLRAGYSSLAIFYLPFFVAQKKNFYSAEGIQVELVNIGRSDVQLQALIAGELQFANFNPDGIIVFDEKGGNLKVIASVVNAAPYILIGGKKYKTIQDLRGARVGVSSFRGGGTSILLEYLKNKGLNPTDYSLVVMAGGTPGRLAALESGAVAAGLLATPQSDIAIDMGFNKLGDTMEVIPNYIFNSINVDANWAEKNRPAVVKFLKAIIRSLTWIHENPDQATEFYSKEMGVKPQYARKGVEYLTRNNVFPKDGSFPLEGLKVNIQVQARDGLIQGPLPLPPPEKYVDFSYLRQAQKALRLH